jgi:archaeal flagellin FlaB
MEGVMPGTRKILQLTHRFLHEEDGITGLETAIVLIAFVVVSSVFAYTILNTGMFSADRSKESITAGMNQTRSNMELKGSVTASADDAAAPTKVASLKFYVGTAAGAEPIDFDPTTLVISYTDDKVAEVLDSTALTITPKGTDNSDKMLDPGETREVVVTVPADATLAANSTFSLEVRPRIGAVMNITRTTPLELKGLMNLS